MHDAAASTIAEYVSLIHDYGKEQGTFHLSIVFDEAGDWSTAFVFGREASDSPMAGGASYGYGKNLIEALRGIVDECRLIEKRTQSFASRTGYAVLERSESLGISHLCFEIFDTHEEAAEHATWSAKHLTGSFADAGDTTCEVVTVLRSAEREPEAVV